MAQKFEIERATRFSDGSYAATLMCDGMECKRCQVVVSDGTGSFGEAGAIVVLPPVKIYKKNDGTNGVDRIVVFANREEANKITAEKVANNDPAFFRLNNAKPIKGGEIIGNITIETPLHLNVRVSKDGVLFIPSFPFEKDGEKRYASYVKPFDGNGEAQTAEKEALVAKIKEIAVDCVPKTENEQ